MVKLENQIFSHYVKTEITTIPKSNQELRAIVRIRAQKWSETYISLSSSMRELIAIELKIGTRFLNKKNRLHRIPVLQVTKVKSSTNFKLEKQNC